MPNKLIVEVIGDTKSYERAMGRSSAATAKFNADIGKTTAASQSLRGALSATKAGGGLGGLLFGSSAFVASAIASKALSTSINAASDLNEQLSRTKVVLGASADEMIKWSETTASSIGISQRAALTAAATFAGLFQSVGSSRKDAAEFSQVLVKLAADLASLQNSTPEEALIALRSGLAGEAEPLRRFNIFLSEARVQQEALAATGKKSTSALTQQEKTVARYNLILQDGAVANNNFRDTSGGLANEQRTLAAETDNLAASVGEGLIPTMQVATAGLIAFVGGINDSIGAVKDFRSRVKDSTFFDGFNKGVDDAGQHADSFFKKIRDGIPGMQHFLDLRNKIISGVQGGPAPFVQPTKVGPRGIAAPGAVATQAVADAKAAQAAIDKATRRANASLSQQISDSATRIAHLKDLIREDPGNVKLQQRLTDEIKKQNTLLGQQKTLNESNARTAKAAADAAHQASVQAAADRKQAQKDAEQARREQVKRSQFKALGLTPEGLRPTPGSGALLRRATGLQDRIKGTVLDTAKNRSQLKRIVDFLKKNFNKAGKDVREAILGMLNDISSAFSDGAKKGGAQGPLTATHGLRTAQIIKNLGLSAEQADEIQRRLAHAVTPGSVGRNRTNAPGASRVPGQHGGPAGPFVVESTVIVQLDGQQIARTVTRNQQKDRRRNPKQKRGQHRN